MPEQNYHAPINTVVNVDISGELAGFFPGSVGLNPRAWLAPTLVDRQPQFEAILERIDSMVETTGGGKLLVVVPGTRSDVHQSLVLRCGMAYFGEYYDQERGWNYLGRVAWPRGAQSVLPILKKIGQALALPKNARNQAAIEDKLANLQQSICFSHHLEAASWNEDEQELVLNWIDYICDKWPPPAPGRFVIAFLCLDSGIEPKDPFAGLIGKLQQARPVGPVLVTKRLDFIYANDVDDWVSEVARYLKLPSLEGLLLNAADDLFSQSRQGLRFSQVYKPLCERLAAILPPGPIFTKSGGS
jgi:inactive STAND